LRTASESAVVRIRDDAQVAAARAIHRNLLDQMRHGHLNVELDKVSEGVKNCITSHNG